MTHAKIFFIHEQTLLDILRVQTKDKYLRPILQRVPEGTVLTKVWYEPTRDQFGFRIEHPSFPEVQPFECPPHCDVSFEMVDIREISSRKLIPVPGGRDGGTIG